MFFYYKGVEIGLRSSVKWEISECRLLGQFVVINLCDGHLIALHMEADVANPVENCRNSLMSVGDVKCERTPGRIASGSGEGISYEIWKKVEYCRVHAPLFMRLGYFAMLQKMLHVFRKCCARGEMLLSREKSWARWEPIMKGTLSIINLNLRRFSSS